ncbi:MAG: alpha/beta fold hydrolase [Hyphomicrobium sp.]
MTQRFSQPAASGQIPQAAAGSYRLAPAREPAMAPSPPVTLPQTTTAAAQVAAKCTGLRLDADRDLSANFAEALDRSRHYMMSRITLGLSPTAVSEAYFDWLINLANAPGKRFQLVEKAVRKSTRLAHYMGHCAFRPEGTAPCIEPLAQDKRFIGEAWQHWPFNVIYQSFLLQQQWWHVATTGVRGVSEKHSAQVNFATRQMLDIFSPANFIWTNPEVLQRTFAEGGANLVRGAWNFVEDWERAVNARPALGSEAFQAGRNLALSPGKVVYRNRLMELIQYAPTTGKVRPEPILIVPAWIMKYYILDLTPENSLVKYLVSQGFTVFMVSWKNPGYEDRDLGMEDYRKLGVMEALDAIASIVPDEKVHGVGYCLGGTLLSIAAAGMARNGDDRLKSLSFLAAQTDFEEAGELTLFIVESQVAFIEDLMREQGYLDTHQMAGAFQMLNSNDLVWSRVIHDYLMGQRRPMNELMAWNADATRLPARMHSEYLRKLFLDNDLAEGRYHVDGRPIALTDIRQPIFAVGTETDHVAPWRSVYKFHLQTDTSVTFLLTNGGHNGGIVSEPGHKGRRYRVGIKHDHERYLDPETWMRETKPQEGSWWPEWTGWLAERSGEPVAAPNMGAPGLGLAPIGDAPGTYVLEA